VLAAAAGEVAGPLVQRPLAAEFSPLALTAVGVWGSAAALIPLLPLAARELTTAGAATRIAVFALALGPTLLAYLLLAAASARLASVLVTASFGLLPPLSALAAGLLLGTSPAPGLLLGAVVVAVGLVVLAAPGAHPGGQQRHGRRLAEKLGGTPEPGSGEERDAVELREAMRTSGAVRKFTDAPVPDEVLGRVLDAARFAPSGGNQQPWVVLVVRDPELRRRLRDLSVLGWREYAAQVAAGVRPFAPGPDGIWRGAAIDLDAAAATPAPMSFIDHLDTVPVLLVLVARLTALAVMDVELARQSIVGGGSIYPFAQNILLAARDEGLGGTITTFAIRRETEAARLLEIPPGHAVAAVMALGYPLRRATRLRRRPVGAFTRVDTFTGPAFGAP